MGSSARVLVAGETNVGMKRTHNEDAFEVIDEERLYLVADGMGGHASGEVASKMAIDTLRYKMDKSRGYEENRLITGIKLANLRIHESAAREPRLRGMGTTLVSILVIDEGVLIAHVGDSRVYRIRDGKMEQLTDDHSLLNDYIKMKRLTEEEIANFPHKNVIVRALGMKETVKVDTRLDHPQPGDLYVLCSDGLCGPVSDEEILEIASSTNDLKQAASRLIERANQNGGPDNITAVLAKWIGAG